MDSQPRVHDSVRLMSRSHLISREKKSGKIVKKKNKDRHPYFSKRYYFKSVDTNYP
jgi:hypothetical protein